MGDARAESTNKNGGSVRWSWPVLFSPAHVGASDRATVGEAGIAPDERREDAYQDGDDTRRFEKEGKRADGQERCRVVDIESLIFGEFIIFQF